MMSSKILDFDKLKKQKFKRKKGGQPRMINGLRVTMGWFNEIGEWVEYSFDPDNPMVQLTTYGQKFLIEQLNEVIAWVCKQDAEVGAEYQRMLERAYKLSDNDE